MWKVLEEFREFALKGNAIDMAVGIIVGGAFGTVVSSLIKDIIMPPIGLLLGGVDFSDIVLTLSSGEGTPVTMNVGLFFNAVFSFLVVAFAVFLLVKTVNGVRRRLEKERAAAPEFTTTEKLLMEIRDALKK